MVQLVIAEKPSVARDLARILGVRTRADGCFTGPKIWVSWCIGHVAELCEPEAYNPAWKAWSAATLPMLPDTFKLRPIADSRSQWTILRRLLGASEVHEVVNACDAGREGELIFRFAYELANCRKPVKRLWLSSLTDHAVQQAFAGLRSGAEFDALADAARCRSEADWLVGLNATRALTVRGRGAGRQSDLLTVGRVQTPTLAMLVRREDEIEAFRPAPFWQVVATFGAAAGDYEGTWTRGKEDRLDQKDEAEAIAAAVRDKAGKVTRLERKEVSEPPPLLFDLTSLQRFANARFGLTAAATLEAAQGLYERHKLLTYPRTDSNYLTQDMAPGLADILRGIAVPPYAAAIAPLLAEPLRPGPRILCDSEVGDHHAIIPTGRSPLGAALTAAERQVFDTVARRFIAAFYPAARFALTRVETMVAAVGDEHTFLSRGKIRLQEGWQAVEIPPGPARGKEAAGAVAMLPNLRKNEPVHTRAVEVRAGETKPPPRYSEAALLGAMERAGAALDEAELRRAMKDAGLGTPATRAAIIENLKRRGYVTPQGKILVPTAQGRRLVAAVPVDNLKSAQLTGEWEARLAQVARGDLSRAAFMQEVRALTTRIVHEIFSGPAPAAPPMALSLPVPVSRPAMQAAAPAAKTAVRPKARRAPPSPAPPPRQAARRASPATVALPRPPRPPRKPRGAAAIASAVETAGMLGTCPVCNTEVCAGPKAYHCVSGRACSFVIFNDIAGRTIEPDVVRLLLQQRRTPVLTGFMSRAGRPFAASLLLGSDGRVTFSFDSPRIARPSPMP